MEQRSAGEGPCGVWTLLICQTGRVPGAQINFGGYAVNQGFGFTASVRIKNKVTADASFGYIIVWTAYLTGGQREACSSFLSRFGHSSFCID